MADIELVIKMNEKDYNDILIGETKASALNYSTFNAIKNGTPLPKRHGRLIDADKYRKDMQESREFNFFATLDFQQTIIEAD